MHSIRNISMTADGSAPCQHRITNSYGVLYSGTQFISINLCQIYSEFCGVIITWTVSRFDLRHAPYAHSGRIWCINFTFCANYWRKSFRIIFCVLRPIKKSGDEICLEKCLIVISYRNRLIYSPT